MIKFLHHRTLDKLENEAAGVYREIDVLVGNHRVIPHQEVPNAMVEFCTWFNTTQENNDMDAATFAADAHNRFVWIHPFEDANGRTRRVLMNMVLKRSGWRPGVLEETFRQVYNDQIINNNIAQFVQEIAHLGNNENVPVAADQSLLSSFHHQHQQQQTASSAGVGPPDGVGCSGFHMLPPPYGNSPSVLRPVKSLSDLQLAADGDDGHESGRRRRRRDRRKRMSARNGRHAIWPAERPTAQKGAEQQ
ncbi:hypothetical protein niasHS_012366 [Heterodera schachtii]|uniref:Fido domain-containing protein n=1 Tax=Heterodera schachtii TaxID=97005 RepID=A0ABD2IMH5_HETSC